MSKPFQKPQPDQLPLTLAEQSGRNPADNTQMLMPDQQDALNDKIAEKILDHFFAQKNLMKVSRIKPEQVSNLTKLKLAEVEFKAPICGRLFDYILQLQISINGLGRGEMVKMIQQRNGTVEAPPTITSRSIFK